MTNKNLNMQVFCPQCGERAVFNPSQYRCACQGAWEPLEHHDFSSDRIDRALTSLWRYQHLFGLTDLAQPLSLGAGWTPLVEADWHGRGVFMKMEYIAPTGSFKDRGTEVEMNFLSALGIEDVVEDSSGNAGASMAAYAARLGLRAAIHAPQGASPAKLAQIQVFGAQLHKIPGTRIEATKAVLRAVENGAVYASHAYNPVYLLGQQSFAWEIWEQFEESPPDAIVIPVGQAGLLLGAWLGFRRLLLSGRIAELPHLFAVQPERLAPIPAAFAAGLDDVPPAQPSEKSVSEGLAIVRPVRAGRILQALRESDGQGLTVSESEISSAYYDLARRGFFVEPSSAVAAAALPQVFAITGESARVVVALTGSGLKSALS